jgi:formylglycine-generating enzyme required for sulfatase activity
MADVFISYKREDREQARALAEALATRGLDVWWDIELLPGSRFADEIRSIIEQAKVAVVLWSERSVTSDYVRAESDLARKRQILIPARLDGCDLPIPFNTLHTLDLTGWDGGADDERIDALVNAVVARVGGQPTLPESEPEVQDRLHRRDAEAVLWRAITEQPQPSVEEYRHYLQRFGDAALFAELARMRIARLEEEGRKRKRPSLGKIIAGAAAIVGLAGVLFALVPQGRQALEQLGLLGEPQPVEESAGESAVAQEEARRQAEEEAKRKAKEAETQRRAAEEEAQRKAIEEEARRQAEEEETRQKAEKAEAQQRAQEEETRRRTEEEAKRKAEEEETRKTRIEAMTAEMFALNNANVRAGPKVKNERLTTLARGSPVTVTGLAGDWYRVALADGRPGFVFRELLGESPPWEPGKVFRDCDVCPEMVVVPAGSFIMGSPPGEELRQYDEGPQHRVTITRPFAVGKVEVTFAEWDACVDAGGCDGYRPKDEWGRESQPVIYVSWQDARSYVKWLSDKTGKDYRLLTEAEWEYTARAGTTTPFHFGGKILPEQAKYARNYSYAAGRKDVDRNKTVPVGSFPSNDFGLHDVHGNVWEWVADCYKDDAYKTHKSYPKMVGSWHDSCERVIRGGSWYYLPWLLRSAIRYGVEAGIRDDDVGFRVARTL